MGQPAIVEPEPVQTTIQHIPEIRDTEPDAWYSFGWEAIGFLIPVAAAILIWYFKERISLKFKKRYDRWKKQHDAGEDV